jgi:hypothetical protein
MHRSLPIKQKLSEFGVRVYNPTDRWIEQIKELFTQGYLLYKKTLERSGDKIWCELGEPEFVINVTNDGCVDVLIRYLIQGRAFYVDRNFNPCPRARYYPNSKNVPKKLRGRRKICVKELF